MALGVEAAGVVTATGAAVAGVAVGDRVMTHSLPPRPGCVGGVVCGRRRRRRGTGPGIRCHSRSLRRCPSRPLTAGQALGVAPGTGPGAVVLVNGAGGVTGTLIVQLARYLGAEVVAVAGPRSAARAAAAGAARVLDRQSPDWPGQVRELTGGRVATIASDPPDAERGIAVRQV